MALTQEQRDFFWANGYLPYGPLLEPAEVAELAAEYDRVMAAAWAAGEGRNLAVDGETDRATQKTAERQQFQLMQMCERSILFRKLVHDDRIVDVIEELVGPNIMLYHDQALNKPPRVGAPTSWHQDNGYWKMSPPCLV